MRANGYYLFMETQNQKEWPFSISRPNTARITQSLQWLGVRANTSSTFLLFDGLTAIHVFNCKTKKKRWYTQKKTDTAGRRQEREYSVGMWREPIIKISKR